MATQMTLFINQLDKGFSETWFHQDDNPTQLWHSLPNSLFNQAMAFRHVSCYLRAIRMTRVGPTALGKFSQLFGYFPRLFGSRGGSSTTFEEMDVTATSGVWHVTDGQGDRRNVWFRGLADIDVIRKSSGIDNPSAALEKAVNTYLTNLYTLGFGIRATLLPPAAGLTWRRIGQVSHLLSVDPNRANFTLVPDAPTLNVGDVVVFNGRTRFLPHFPRVAEILAKQTVDGVTNYTIAYQLPGGVTVTPKSLKLTIQARTIVRIDDWLFSKFGPRKTGRPFGLSAGRARAVALTR